MRVQFWYQDFSWCSGEIRVMGCHAGRWWWAWSVLVVALQIVRVPALARACLNSSVPPAALDVDLRSMHTGDGHSPKDLALAGLVCVYKRDACSPPNTCMTISLSLRPMASSIPRCAAACACTLTAARLGCRRLVQAWRFNTAPGAWSRQAAYVSRLSW